MAEGVGFEPTVLSYNGFQDRRLKPLGHPSVVFHSHPVAFKCQATCCNRRHSSGSPSLLLSDPFFNPFQLYLEESGIRIIVFQRRKHIECFL